MLMSEFTADNILIKLKYSILSEFGHNFQAL